MRQTNGKKYVTLLYVEDNENKQEILNIKL